MGSFSCIEVKSINDGVATLSQNHFKVSVDDIGEEYRSKESTRNCTIPIRSDETASSLFKRLNKDDTYVIENGFIKKVVSSPTIVSDDCLAELD